MTTLKSNAFSVLKGLSVKTENAENQSLESLGYVPPKPRKKSTKAEITQKMLKSLKEGNLEKFSASIDDGANWRVQCNRLPVVLYIIYKMSPEFLDCLIEKTNFSLKNPTEESMKGVDLHSFRAYKDLTDLLELAGENHNPKMLERLLKDIKTDENLWRWLPGWKSAEAMNWFLKTQDLFPKHLDPKRKIKEKLYLEEFITDMFHRNTSDWDPVSFLKRIKEEYPEVLKVMQTPEIAENIWLQALSPLGSIYKQDKGILCAIQALIDFDVTPPLKGDDYPFGLIWFAHSQNKNDVAFFLLQSEALALHTLECAKEAPTQTLFNLEATDPLFLFFKEKTDITRLVTMDGENILQNWVERGFLTEKELDFVIENPNLLYHEDKAGLSVANNSNRILKTKISPSKIPEEIRVSKNPSDISLDKLIVYVEHKNLEEKLVKSTSHPQPKRI